MKYLLSILCLFIFSCDSGGDDDGISDFVLLEENFTYPTSLDTYWAYQSTEIVEDSNGEISWALESTLERSIVSEFVNPPESFSDDDCNIKIEDVVEFNTIVGGGLDINPGFDEINCDDENLAFDTNLDGCICCEGDEYFYDYDQYSGDAFYFNYLENISVTYYTSLLNDEQEFDTCQSYRLQDSYENEDNSGGHNEIPDVVTKVIEGPHLNRLKLEYPLYIGKTWTDEIDMSNVEEPDAVIIVDYEIVSKENIILDIDGTSTLFESYKIIVNTNGFEKVFYLSSIGIVKVSFEEVIMNMTTVDEPDGTGEQGMMYYEMNLINFNIPN